MKRHTRKFVILATVALAAVPMLAGCVVEPAGVWVRGHYVIHDGYRAHYWR
jgi:hypothetical protein